MSLLLILSLMLGHGPINQKQDQASVSIFVVSQRKFNNRGHHPWNNRKVIFKMVNESTKSVTVYGTRFDDGFEPTGYIITFDANTGQWVYPNSDNSPIAWSNRSEFDREKFVLLPGKSLAFEAEMSRAEAGVRFKRTAYISFKEGEEPIEIRGDEFVLK